MLYYFPSLRTRLDGVRLALSPLLLQRSLEEGRVTNEVIFVGDQFLLIGAHQQVGLLLRPGQLELLHTYMHLVVYRPVDGQNFNLSA